jgi:hypothetical protein
MAKKILVSLTSITPGEWRNKVKEIDELGIKEMALFLTCLNKEERKELFALLEKTKLKKIPHVHLRDDMEVSELDYLTRRFAAEVFNIHPENSTYPLKNDLSVYAGKIYVENVDFLPTERDLKKYAGLCLDLSHWEDLVIKENDNSASDSKLKAMVNRHKIGCNHISAIKQKITVFQDRNTKRNFFIYGSHNLKELSELDYVKKYKNYLADIISIELENPLKRQLEAKKYLEKILDL